MNLHWSGKRLRDGLLLLGFAAVLPAQNDRASLTGIVTDQSKGVIANATVALNELDTGSQRTTICNASGLYIFSSLPLG
ncbi:MAG TPA: carboxypeptidase-like regulatory domain-containing protein, partial [Bryobacteraceae bacterium]|nr:carboxypeptidase-like regulatory domain-containing protein [Bryobacteraceae bacterium]